MERIRALLPEQPAADRSFGVRYCWDAVSSAIEELSAAPGAIPRGGRAPYRVEWTRRFQNARRNVSPARSWIEKAEQGRGV
jgi:hypothetical protein